MQKCLNLIGLKKSQYLHAQTDLQSVATVLPVVFRCDVPENSNRVKSLRSIFSYARVVESRVDGYDSRFPWV